jgi:hypothetical protein
MMNDEQEQVIVVRVPPQRLRWLAAELRSAGLPFEVERAGDAYHVQTSRTAAPTLRKVLDSPAQSGWKPRSGASLVRLIVGLGGVVAAAWLGLQVFGGMAAAGLGVNPSFLRAGAILLVGVVGTFSIAAWIGKPPGGMPDTRWQLVLGLLGLFISAALGVALVGMGAIR